jgi:ferredoxin-NADP reductase
MEVQYLGGELCGAAVATFRFGRPPTYEFRAGQWFVLALQTPAGVVKETFSHSTAPSDDWLELTTRLSGSPFKLALAALAPGDVVGIVGPGGRLSLPEGAEQLAFLAGGVGITPVRSLLRDARSRGRVLADAVLFYGNRDAECIPYGNELAAMSDIGVRVVDVLEDPPQGWTGESGFITAAMVRRHLDSDDGRIFFVTGPPAMVGAMEDVLDEVGVPVERRVVERFGAVK